MTVPLSDKVENALNEARILILGSQVIVGLDFRSVFEKGFRRLPEAFQDLKLGGLVLMTLVLGLLVSPAAYHRIVEDGFNSGRLHAYISRVTGIALLPFALAIGSNIAVSTGVLIGPRAAVAGGLAGCGVSLLFWYGLEEAERWRLGKGRGKAMKKDEPRPQSTPLDERIRNVLTETRVVLPGAQAMLGFQFLAVLTDRFEELPEAARLVHFLSLASIALTTILLMSPAAWHRIVEEGENSERFHRVASIFLLVSLVTLALGMAGDLFVVFFAISEKTGLAVTAAGVVLLFFYGLWFGYTTWRRSARKA